MKRSSKIVLYGLLISILYIILCVFIKKDDFNNKPETINKQELKEPQIESVDINNSSIKDSKRVVKNSSTLDYKIENGAITIGGNMPILAEDDSLKKSMIRFCSKEYCKRTIIFSANKEMPLWKNLAKDIIDIFYDENLTNASFLANEQGDITIGGEFLTKSSKDRLLEILKQYGTAHITDNSYIKEKEILSTPKEEKDTVISDKNESESVKIADSITNNSTVAKRDKIDIAQEKITELLKSENINFYRSRAKLTSRGKRTLRKIIAILKEIPDVKIEVRGYTDASGKRRVNKWISDVRAKSVKLYLGSHGINSDNIEAKGFGEDDLLYKDKPYSPLNRRVEIEIKRR